MPIDAKNPFHAVRKTRASLQIVDQARDLITRGDLKPGDRLPSERKLAEILGVGRTTVREALRAMESLGLVEVRPGDGTFLADPTARRRPELLGTDGVDSWSTQLNLLELRAVLEPPLAGLAARRATPEHLVRMRAALTAQAASVERGESGMEEDAAFHFLIAKATGNPTLVRLIESLTHSLGVTRAAVLQRNGRSARSLKQNQGILQAIESRNSALAVRRMHAHIRSLDRLVFAAGQQSLEEARTSTAPSPEGSP